MDFFQSLWLPKAYCDDKADKSTNTLDKESSQWSKVNKQLFLVVNSGEYSGRVSPFQISHTDLFLSPVTATSFTEAALLYPLELIKTRQQMSNDSVTP